ncbi:plasmid pRiA4b ORF-3 family protein [Cereibacter sp. SYSU M97828]|nr:plasmid pRiA4b ORF-3 family protein [Cereibacter flavus]
MQTPKDPIIIRADVHIAGIAPPICRTLELPLDLNFAQLHEVIQAAFGWSDTHLHQFNLGGLTIGAPEYLEDGFGGPRVVEATSLGLGHLTFPRGHEATLTLLYDYDFGDDWQHVLTLRRAPREAGVRYPRCTGGTRACPPEDVGGVSGFEEFLVAWSDPAHEDHKQIRRWAGRGYDPERFDLAKANKAINKAMLASGGEYRARQL